MKINELTKQMFESIRYGAREASMIEGLGARIGLEFEFHISDEYLESFIGNYDDAYDEIIRQIIEDRSEQYQQELSKLSNNIVTKAKNLFEMTDDDWGFLVREIEYIKELIDEDKLIGSNELNVILSYLESFNKWNEGSVNYFIHSFIFSELGSLILDLDIENPNEFVNRDLPEYKFIYDHIVSNTRSQDTKGISDIKEMVTTYVDLYKRLSDALNDSSDLPFMRSKVNEIAKEFIEFFENDVMYEQIIDLKDMSCNPNDFTSFEIDETYMDPIIKTSSNLDDEAVLFVKSELPIHTDMNMIENIEIDSSVQKGAEVITKPLEYREAIQIIDDMAEFIEKYGYTSDSTGLHMNVSLPSGMTLDDIDPLIFLLLLDSNYIDDKFASRNYVNSMMNYFKDKEVNAAYDYLTNGPQSLIDLTRAYIPTKVKYQQINFSHLSMFPRDDSRIEYRAPGGDYIKDIDLIKSELTRLLYMLNATINYETVYPRERMLKDVIRLWDRVSMKSSNRTFSDVINDIAIQHGMRTPKAGVRT